MHVAPPKQGRSIPTKLVAQIAKGGASGPSGKCRKIGDVDGAWRSAYNASRKFARVWEFTHGLPDAFGLHVNVAVCEGRNNLVAPHTAKRELSFNDAEGLGGL
jgi:hypothetical protein